MKRVNVLFDAVATATATLTSWKEKAKLPSMGRLKKYLSLGVATLFLSVVATLAWSVVFPSSKASSFPFLEIGKEEQQKYRIVSDGEWSTKDWKEIEREVTQFAELKIGSFAGERVGKKDIKIHYRRYLNRNENRGAIIISSGRTEGVALYQELILDLVQNGYSVYIHDHRGQGFSSRLDDKDSQLGHVDDFRNYVSDLKKFVSEVVKPDGQGKQLFLLAHSMGGAIASLYLEDPATAKDFRAAALVTPMHQPWADSGETDLKERLAKDWCNHPIGLSFQIPKISREYLYGGPFDQMFSDQFKDLQNNEAAMYANDATHSISRYRHNWITRQKASCQDEPHCGNGDAKVGAPSKRWFRQACESSERARGVAAQQISVPILLLQGSEDTIVRPSAQQEFCEQVNRSHSGGYCVGNVIGARHAAFIEADDVRKPVLAKIFSFFDCTREGGSKKCQ